jgi:hypothetical protein
MSAALDCPECDRDELLHRVLRYTPTNTPVTEIMNLVDEYLSSTNTEESTA